jgi:hypothetical protein
MLKNQARSLYDFGLSNASSAHDSIWQHTSTHSPNPSSLNHTNADQLKASFGIRIVVFIIIIIIIFPVVCRVVSSFMVGTGVGAGVGSGVTGAGVTGAGVIGAVVIGAGVTGLGVTGANEFIPVVVIVTSPNGASVVGTTATGASVVGGCAQTKAAMAVKMRVRNNMMTQ